MEEAVVTGARERFLGRVRQALAADDRPGQAKGSPPRGAIGYQGAGPDPVGRFCEELTTAGGHAHRVRDRADAVAAVCDIVKQTNSKRILLGQGSFIDSLDLESALGRCNADVVRAGDLASNTSRERLFAADLGITGVYAAVAETGSLALSSGPDEPRSFSLLPPIHIAVVERGQLVPDLFDLFGLFPGPSPELPSCLSLVTGPSKTGDIELRLVTGVHGPGELHVVIVGD
jgi:L-lactate utilization protein LutC